MALGRRGRGPEGTCGGSGLAGELDSAAGGGDLGHHPGSAVASVTSRFTSSMSHTLASSTRPTLEPSATITRRRAASSMARLTSASGRLTLVTPTSGSTPLQPTKATEARRRSSRTVPSGLTSECWRGRRVPPVTTTLTRGVARSSSRAMLSPLVTTVTSRRSVRRTSAGDGGGGRADVQDHGVAGPIMAAACTPMLAFWRGRATATIRRAAPRAGPRGHGAAPDPAHPGPGLQRGQVGPDRDRRHPEPVGQVGDPREPRPR